MLDVPVHPELETVVADLVEALQAGALLRPRARVSSGDACLVVEDFAEALDRAHRRPLTDESDADTWTDLRQREAARLLAATPAALRAAVRRLGEPFTRAVMQQLPAPYQAIADDVGADLQNIALSRVATGAAPGLFDQLWEVYRQGGWPCGWEGGYPEGRLVVFQPRLVP